jgi:hypothetical protein
MTAIWQITASRTRERNPRALEILQVFSSFALKPIPLRIFTGNGGARNLPEAFSDPIQFSRALHELRRTSLAEVDQRMRTVRLHRLVRLLCQEERTDEENADSRHSAHLLLAAKFPKGEGDQAPLGCCAEIAAHLESLRIAECPDGNVRAFCIHAVRCLAWSGLHVQSRALAERCRELWGADPATEGPHLAELERLLRETDDQEPGE